MNLESRNERPEPGGSPGPPVGETVFEAQILIRATDNEGKAFTISRFEELESAILERFGGFTLEPLELLGGNAQVRGNGTLRNSVLPQCGESLAEDLRGLTRNALWLGGAVALLCDLDRDRAVLPFRKQTELPHAIRKIGDGHAPVALSLDEVLQSRASWRVGENA